MVVHGFVAEPSLPPPAYAASTNCVVASVATSPHGAAPHGETAWHFVSPGNAICPLTQGRVGSTAVQPPASSCSNPAPHPSGGTPGGLHAPSAPTVNPG